MAAIKRNIQFGTIMNMIYLIAIFMTIGAIGRLVWWSYNETLKLSSGVTGSEYGINLATLVQLGPLVFLLARRTFMQHKMMPGAAKILLALAIIFNLADMVTNFLAYAIGGYVLPSELLGSFNVNQIPADAAWVLEASKWFGYFVCAIITWGEEGIVWLVAIAGHYIWLVAADMGYRAPDWMSVTRQGAAQPQPKQQPRQEQGNGQHAAVPAPQLNPQFYAANAQQQGRQQRR